MSATSRRAAADVSFHPSGEFDVGRDSFDPSASADAPSVDLEAVTLLRQRSSRGADSASTSQAAGTGGPVRGSPPPADEPTRYEKLEPVGRGAMGEVHLARDVLLRRKVAYKSLHTERSSSMPLLTRFVAEAQITAQLDHPNIVPVYGLEVASDGAVGYAMKLVRGQELAALVQTARDGLSGRSEVGRSRDLAERLDIFVKICDAMAFAHHMGIVHRDLKPANIMLGEHHEVYVMDWGIARRMGGGELAAEAGVEIYEPESEGEDARRTQLGSVLGTPLYMSPEQARGHNDQLDGRSDQFSLGLILQEIVTLERARHGKSLREAIETARRGERDRPSTNPLGVPVARELDAIITKATAPRPDDRYASTTDLADDVRRFLRGEAVMARPDTLMQRIGRWVAQHRIAALAIGGVASVVAVAASIVAVVIHHEHREIAEANARELALRLEQQRIGELVAGVGQQRYRIERDLARYESELEQLAAAASMWLGSSVATIAAEPALAGSTAEGAHGAEAARPIRSPRFGRPIDVAAPAVVASPDASAAQGSGHAQPFGEGSPGLAVLGPVMRETVLDSMFGDGDGPGAAAEDHAIAAEPIPIRRAYLTLPSGIHIAFPGMGGYPAGFDGRKLEAYERAIASGGQHWTGPAIESNGSEQVVTCSTALRGADGRLLGVAAIEIALFETIAPLVDVPELPYVERAMLVGSDGRVVVHMVRDPSRAGSPLVAATELGTLPEPIVDAIGTGRPGYRELPTTPRGIAAYAPLEVSSWSLVAMAAASPVRRDLELLGPGQGVEPPRARSAKPATSSSRDGRAPTRRPLEPAAEPADAGQVETDGASGPSGSASRSTAGSDGAGSAAKSAPTLGKGHVPRPPGPDASSPSATTAEPSPGPYDDR